MHMFTDTDRDREMHVLITDSTNPTITDSTNPTSTVEMDIVLPFNAAAAAPSTP